MKPIFLLTIILTSFTVKAQNDTLYIFFENMEPNVIIKQNKLKKDPNPLNYYPFDGGRIYKIPKQVGKFRKDLHFVFWSYTLDDSDVPFYYIEEDKSILKEKDFKTRKWFENKSYGEIITKFHGREKVIMLIDETQMSKIKSYMVRVYFSYPAEE